MQNSRQLAKLLEFLSPDKWTRVKPWTQKQLLLSLEKNVSENLRELQAKYLKTADIVDAINLCIFGAVTEAELLDTLIDRRDLISQLNQKIESKQRFISIIDAFLTQCDDNHTYAIMQSKVLRDLQTKITMRTLIDKDHVEIRKKIERINQQVFKA